MTDHETHSEEAAEYVLGLLTLEARQAFAARLARDPALQSEVRFWQESLVTFAEDVAPVAPPSGLKAQIEGQLFGARVKSGWWTSVAFWRGVSFASLAAAAGLAFVLTQTPPTQQGTEGPRYITQLGDETAEVQLVAFYDADREQLQIARAAGGARGGRVLELWIIAPGGAPVSLGVLPAGEKASLTVPKDMGLQLAGAILAISDEPPGGSPTGAPTGDVLATGVITEI
jgi:anti-sigma-K factor RskA